MHSLCPPPPKLALHSQSYQHRCTMHVQECVCVGAADGSAWPHLEIRGEALHCPREADLINKAIVMALFAHFCRVHSMKCIYHQSEL